MDVPATEAVSATPLRTVSSSWPGLMPDATIVAAVPAASPIPNAVPFTDARALSMMPATSVAELPNASSFFSAFEVAFRRLKPLAIDPERDAPAATPTDAAPTLRALPIAFDRPVPMLVPFFWTAGSTSPNADLIFGAIFDVSGMIVTHAFASSTPAIIKSPFSKCCLCPPQPLV